MELFSQYKAPILKCVYPSRIAGNDNIIEWIDPNETCGSFLKFNLFYATNFNGPYQLLTTITSQTTSTYTHVGVNRANIYYYYMNSEYSCPGISNYSDTFSDTAMINPDLISISIENGYAVYLWKPLDLKKTNSYTVYRDGVKIIAVVNGRQTSTYTDTSFDVTKNPYTGAVTASDACGNYGGYPLGHRPSFLTLVNNPCDDEIELTWTRYQGWGKRDEVKDYDILVKKNGETEMKVTTNDSGSRTFRYKDFKYGDTLCIRVRANHPNDANVFSHSNQFCFISSKSQKPNIFQTLSASYLDNYATKLRWYCSPDAVVRSFDMIRYLTRNGEKQEVKERINYINEGNGFYSFIDTQGAYSAQVSYGIVFEDMCNNKSSGIPGYTNFIQVTQTGLYSNEVVWPKKLFPDSIIYTIKKLELFFSKDGISFSKIAEPNWDDRKYTHNVESFYQSEGKFYYRLNVTYSFDTTTSIKDSIFFMYSQSPLILMRTVMFMPNAFKVNGYTPVFKPKMYFFSSIIFRMKIFNRWGQQIYETNDPEVGWNGKMSNGQEASEDSYIYHIAYQGNDGVSVEKTGTFVLLK